MIVQYSSSYTSETCLVRFSTVEVLQQAPVLLLHINLVLTVRVLHNLFHQLPEVSAFVHAIRITYLIQYSVGIAITAFDLIEFGELLRKRLSFLLCHLLVELKFRVVFLLHLLMLFSDNPYGCRDRARMWIWLSSVRFTLISRLLLLDFKFAL